MAYAPLQRASSSCCPLYGSRLRGRACLEFRYASLLCVDAFSSVDSFSENALACTGAFKHAATSQCSGHSISFLLSSSHSNDASLHGPKSGTVSNCTC